MKIELEGATCVLTGRMKTTTKAEAKRRLEAAGATVRTSVSAKTSFVVVTEQWTNAHTDAKAMGLPILSEAQLVALLDGEVVEVEEVGEAGERSVDELLGEVRSVMQGPPTSLMWHALVALLDACREEDVHVLTRYIDSYIARWSPESMDGQQATTIDLNKVEEEAQGIRWYWRSYSSISGELRVAPEHWVGELQQGVRSPKFAIVRALDLRDSRASSKAIIALLDHPDLVNLEVLKLSMDLKMSGALIARICQDERLRDLGPGETGARQTRAFLEHGRTDSPLRTLDLRCTALQQYGDTHEYLGSCSFDQVRHLILPTQKDRVREILDHLDNADALQSVHVLDYTPYFDVAFVSGRIMRSSWVIEHIRELDLGEVNYRSRHDPGSWRQFLDFEYEGHLDLLDMSGLYNFDDREDTTKVDQMLNKYLPDAKLLQSVDKLVLGSWKTEKLRDKIAANYPDLEVL